MSLLIYLAFPVFIATMWLERALLRRQGRDSYEPRDAGVSLALGVGNVINSALVKGFVVALGFALYQHRLFEIGRGPLAWLMLFFAEDLCYYAYHRAHHAVRCLWAAHSNHHSSERYHLATALRQSWTSPFTGLWFWLPLPLLGFHPLLVMTQQAISLLYQYWIHTELIGRLGPLEWVLNTPSHHRVHHASNARYLDRNHAGILIIWDRLFGTFVPETLDDPPRYGLTSNISSRNPARVAMHEWLAMCRDVAHARTWRERFAYVFGPPGWSPDGSTRTARQLREAAALGAQAAR